MTIKHFSLNIINFSFESKESNFKGIFNELKSVLLDEIRSFKYEAWGNTVTFLSNEIDFWYSFFDKTNSAYFFGFSYWYFFHILEFRTDFIKYGCYKCIINFEEIEVNADLKSFFIFRSFGLTSGDEFSSLELFEYIIDIFDLFERHFCLIFINFFFAIESMKAKITHDASMVFIIEYCSP